MGLLLFRFAKPIEDLDWFIRLRPGRPCGCVVVFIDKPIVDIDGFIRLRPVRPCGSVVVCRASP